METKELANLLKNITILYVEDDASIRNTMKSALENFSNKVIIASNGDDGLSSYYKTQPQIIISDIQMPKLDGLELVKAIRKENQKVPIILLTAFTEEKYLLPAANLDIQAYLVKPLSAKELKDALFKAINFLNQNSSLVIQLSNELKYNKLNSELIGNDNKPIKLNNKEKMLLDLLLDNINRVVSYEEIETAIWSNNFEVMSNMALRTIVKNLRRKTFAELIINISGHGYKITI